MVWGESNPRRVFLASSKHTCGIYILLLTTFEGGLGVEHNCRPKDVRTDCAPLIVLLDEFSHRVSRDDVLKPCDDIVDVYGFRCLKEELNDGLDAHREGAFGLGIVADLES